MSNARDFLDLYNELEALLNEKYPKGDRRYANRIIQFINEDEGRRFREELDFCREVRNLLSHNPRIDGEELVSPSEHLIEVLRTVISEIKNPPTALSLCTPTAKLLLCTGGERVSDVVRTMNKMGFSHVPILDDGIVEGVFSAGAVIAYLASGDAAVDGKTRISQLSGFLAPSAHMAECYRFTAPDASYYEMKDAFVPSGPQNARVAALFVTENGKENSPLLGMITPWDLLRAFPE